MRRVVLLALLASAAALLLCVSGVHAALPIRPPVELKQQSHAPTERAGELSIAPPMLEVSPTPEMRSAGLYAPDQFPSEVPQRPNVNSEPLPLSPPGTYLHTAVLIKNRMYVYGGLSSYEPDKYMNDMWLFDAGESEFVQLQGNYVPPLPQASQWLKPKDAESFAPRDVPEMPELQTAPRHERSAVEHLNPNANPVSPFLPRARAQKPVRVVALEHMYEKDANKPLASGMGSVEQIYNPAAAAARRQKIAQQQQQNRARQQQQRAELRAKKNRGSQGAAALSPAGAGAAAGGELRLTEQEWKVRNAILTLQKLEAGAVHVVQKQQQQQQQPQQQQHQAPAAHPQEPQQHVVPQHEAPQQQQEQQHEAPQEAQTQEEQVQEEQQHQQEQQYEQEQQQQQQQQQQHEQEPIQELPPQEEQIPEQIREMMQEQMMQEQIQELPHEPIQEMPHEPIQEMPHEPIQEMPHEPIQEMPQEPAPLAFVELEDRLSLHHKERSRFLHRTLAALQSRGGSGGRRQGATNWPGDNSGTPYSDPRVHRDGIAADQAQHEQPPQDRATQKFHRGAATAESAPRNARETVPHASQDFWCYDFDAHAWEVVNVTSSQPLAHSPWFTPAQLEDPVFKDPLPIVMPPQRRLHTSVVMKDRMIVFGGVSYNNLILGDIWIFSPEEQSWIEASADGPGGSPILPREGHSAITTGDELTMLVFGGVSYGFLPFNDLWSYSAVENRWTRLSSHEDQSLPLQRWLHTAVFHEASDSMIVFGGITAHYVPLNDVHVYDIASNTWSKAATTETPPFPRMMHTAVVFNDWMLVSGGAANNLPMDDMFVLDIRTWAWRELIQTSAYPFARTGASAIMLSPARRAREEGESADLSPDASDPHLSWFADQNVLASRPVVGSFSSEGLAEREEQEGNLAGLDQIAFPLNPVVPSSEFGTPAAPRPLFRYRKHAQNQFYMVLFGGASATSAPQDNTKIEKGDETRDE